MPRAILLKTKSVPTDPYDSVFRDKTPLIPVFVPVLVHQRVNESQLRSILENEPQDHYTALIVTSQRAVEAIDDAMKVLSGIPALQTIQLTLDEQLRLLRAMTVYTVGPATALAITKLHFSTIVGADTGNGTALANLITQTYRRDQAFFLSAHTSSHPSSEMESLAIPRLPLLFLVGDKRRDIIPKRLAEESIALEELTVYETTVAETFDEELDRVMNDTTDGDIEWIVFFSPSGAEVALEKMKKLERKIKVATIGPTTEEYLRKEWGVVPDMVAKKPEPLSMVQGILDCMNI